MKIPTSVGLQYISYILHIIISNTIIENKDASIWLPKRFKHIHRFQVICTLRGKVNTKV